MVDIEQIYKWWAIFQNNGGKLCEVRCLDGKKTYSGYYHNIENLIRDVAPLSDRPNMQIYFVLNTINKDCYDRQQQERMIENPKNTTTDADILGRNFILLDFDPKRPAGVGSTDDQFKESKIVAKSVYNFLLEQGFYEPIVCKSGNGTHLLIPVHLANTPENTKLVERFLKAIAMLFSNEKVDCDVKVGNASRICKLYGTYAKKGANTPEHPWRLAKVWKCPDVIQTNKREYIEKIANIYPDERPAPSRDNNFGQGNFDIIDFFNRHNIEYRAVQISGGTRYILKECPFDSGHKDPDSMVFQHDNGALAFMCYHNSCSNYTWRDFRLHYESDAYDNRSYEQFKYKQMQQMTKYQLRPPETQPLVETAAKGAIWLKMSQIKRPKFDIADYIPSGIEQIDKLMVGFKRKHVSVWSGYRGCVDCDTEFFDGYRWKKISEYEDGDMVLQYNSDGTATLVKPKLYHKIPCETLTHIHNNIGTINQCVCDEHNLVYITSKGNLHKDTVGNIKKKWISNGGSVCGDIIPHFEYSGSGVDYTDDEICLFLAVSAESNVVTESTKYFRINLKHQYKKDELERLLRLCNIPYKKKKYNHKDLEFDSYMFHWNKGGKVFPLEWYNMTNEQLEVVTKNVFRWDGRIIGNRGGSYSTTVMQNADFIQFAFSATHRKAHIGFDKRVFRRGKAVYIVTVTNHSCNIKISGKGRLFMEEYKTTDGFKYCFTVDSGMLVLRRNNSINITGNCAKTTVLNQLILNAAQREYKTALWTGELDGDEEKKWLYLQAAGKTYNRMTTVKDFYYTPDNVCDKIDPWIDKYMWIFNNQYGNNFNQIVEKLRELKRNNDIDMAIFDNLMTLDIDDLDGDKNDRQKNLIQMLTELARELDIHIHIVAHPNKSGTFLRPNNISGSGHIPDLAQNVFIMHRVNQDFCMNAKEFLPNSVIEEILNSHCTNCIEICKCRDKGSAVDHFIRLFFEMESNRLKNDVAENIIYNWCPDAPQIKMQSYTVPSPTQAIMPNVSFDEDPELPFDGDGSGVPF